MVLVIDNYDSFTYNLVQYLGELGAEVRVMRNDVVSLEDVVNANADRIVISPGPGRPEAAGVTMSVIRRLGETTPILGVCLGHQAIGAVFGGEVVRAVVPMHGKTSTIEHDGLGVFAGIPGPFVASRYHSLIVADTDLPADLIVSARTREDHTIMGLRHRSLPVHGVQFHPESIASEHGHLILKNFLDIAAAWNVASGRRRPRGTQARRRAAQ
jgi:anthranilate synthase component 2